MSVQSSNIIPLTPGGDEKPPQSVLFSDLNQLVQQIIFPEVESLTSALLTHLETNLEVINNNQDMMRWVDIKNRLKNSEESIKNRFINALIRPPGKQIKPEEDTWTLELLDNDELDHKLLWLSAANHFENSQNSERICRIKNCLDSKYPEFNDTYPGMPERICESFSTAIESLHADKGIEQQLFTWFARHLQKAGDELWLSIDNLLVTKGLKPEQPSPVAPLETNKNSNPVQPATSITSFASQNSPTDIQNAYPQADNPEFMDAFADKLISRLENMLAEDEIIPEAKANRVRAIDLANVLSTLQLEIFEQHTSIKNLHNSVIDALEIQGVNSNLSRHHDDLINMIGWLFKYILEDHNLPDDIKKTIALLQIPILKQAILHDAFLTDQEHPARLLLNALTAAGVQYCRNPVLGNHVLMLIEHTVRTIISDHSENPEIFQDCLEGFKYNLTLILQAEHNDSESQEPQTEDNEASLEEQEQEKLTEVQTEMVVEDDSKPEPEPEPEEEIILSSDHSENTQQSPPLTLTDPETIEEPEPHELELAIEDSYETVSEPLPLNTTVEPVIINELHPGQWVEFIGEGDSRRLNCKLARLSKDRLRYIFVNRSGMRVAERSGSELRKGIENGSVRILEENPVFDRAIQAVLKRFKKHGLKH